MNGKQTNSISKNTKATLITASVMLGAIFALGVDNLIAHADVDPEMVDFTSNDLGPIHPGTIIVPEKNVTLTQSIVDPVNVTEPKIYNEGTMDDCTDLHGDTVLSLVTANETTFQTTGFLLYEETFVGMPGVYHCNVIFDVVNATNAADTEQIGNQTVWIEAIGSKGYWNHHPEQADLLLWKLVGDYNVTNSTLAQELFNAHKGKFDLDKLAAQLLAAKLNVMALDGDGDTSCIDQTISDADALLSARGYDGPDVSTGKLSKSDKAEALALHSALDDFNNFGCT